MSRLFNGSSDLAQVVAAIAAGTPFTICAWIKPDLVTAEMAVAGGFDTSDTTIDANALVVSGNVAGDPLRAYTVTGGSGFNISEVNGVVAGSWQHVAGVFASTSSRKAYLGGSGGAAETTSDNPAAAIDTFIIGARRTSTVTNTHFDGRIAEVAVWNVALSDAEIATLAGGAAATSVQGAALIHYWTLATDGTDSVGSADLTFTGTTHDADHPSIGGPVGSAAITLGALTLTAAGTLLSGSLSGYDVARTVATAAVARAGATRSGYFRPVPKITFNGVDRTLRVLKPTFEMQTEVDRTSTARFTVRGTLPSYVDTVLNLDPLLFYRLSSHTISEDADIVRLATEGGVSHLASAVAAAARLSDFVENGDNFIYIPNYAWLIDTTKPRASLQIDQDSWEWGQPGPDSDASDAVRHIAGAGADVPFPGDDLHDQSVCTLEGWIRCNVSMASSEYFRIINIGAVGGTGGIDFGLFEGKPRCRIDDGFTEVAITSVTGVDGGDGTWHQLVAVFDGPNATLRLYLDGASIGSADTSALLGTIFGGGLFRVGVPSASSDPFLTDIVYYEAALSEDDVASLYAARAGDFIPNLYDEVEVTLGPAGDVKIFGGWVTNTRAVAWRAGQRFQRYEVECSDHSFIMNMRRVWAQKFTAQQASAIVASLMATYFDEILDWDFIEQDLPEIDFQSNHGERFSDVLNRIAKQVKTAYGETPHWYLDPDRNLHYFLAAERDGAPLVFSNSENSVKYWDLEVERDGSQLRNHVYALGRSTSTTAVAAAGDSTLLIDDTTGFTQPSTSDWTPLDGSSAAVGRARVGANYITFTGRSTTSGPGYLIGIPTSGAYALRHAVEQGETVTIVVEHANLAAMNLARRITGNLDVAGAYIDHVLEDGQAGTEALLQLAKANNARYAHLLGERRIHFKTRDLNARVGKNLTMAVRAPLLLNGEFLIQRVILRLDKDPDKLPIREIFASRDEQDLVDVLGEIAAA